MRLAFILIYVLLSASTNAQHYAPVFRAAMPPDINETSGLIFTDGKLWTINDSGNDPVLFCIDSSDGHITQRVIIDNYKNTDWEEITADRDYFYIGDFGNNAGNRGDLKVLKVAKADIGKDAEVHVKAEVISFSYSDQKELVKNPYRHNFDCEAFISIKQTLYLFTKNWGDTMTKVYKLSKTPGTYTITPYTSYPVGCVITGATYNEDTKDLLLVGYLDFMKHSYLWLFSDYKGDMFFSGKAQMVDISKSPAWQTEAVSFIDKKRFFLSNETAGGNDAALYIGEIKELLKAAKK